MGASTSLRFRLVPTDSDIAAGISMLCVGVFLVIAFSGAFELALLVLGGLLALVSLAVAGVSAARRRGWRSWTRSLVLALIGAGLLIHEFIPAGDIIHASAALGAFGLGGFQIYHGIRQRRPAP